MSNDFILTGKFATSDSERRLGGEIFTLLLLNVMVTAHHCGAPLSSV